MSKENNVYRGMIGIDRVIFIKEQDNKKLIVITHAVSSHMTCMWDLDKSKVVEFFKNLLRAVINVQNDSEHEVRSTGFLDNNYDTLYKVVSKKASRVISVKFGDVEFTLYLGSYNPNPSSVNDIVNDNDYILKDVESIIEWLRNSEEDE